MRVRVLLVSILPNSHRNLSVLSLYATLKESGIETKLLFLPKRLEYNHYQLEDFVRLNGFGLVGISLMTDGFHFANEITKDIKKVAPTTTVVYGGIHPTLRPGECLDYADCVCIGEGEQALLSLVRRIGESKDYSDLPNIGTKLNGRMNVNQLAPLETNLDSLPFIKYDWDNFYVMDGLGLFPFTRHKYCFYSAYGGEDYTIMSSRSCPFRCSYCCNTFLRKLYGGKAHMRKRSVDNIIAELSQAVDNIGTVRFINFMDEQFLTMSSWVDEFTEKYRSQIGLPFIAQVAPGTFSEQTIGKLKKAGMRFVVAGIQSGSKRTNREVYHRHFNRDTIIKDSRMLVEAGIHPYYDVIIQNELETDSDRDETVRLLLDIKKPFSLTFYGLTPFPETELAKMYIRKGIASKVDPYTSGYKDYDKNDIYYRLCSVIPYTWNWVVWLFWKMWVICKLSFLLSLYYRLTISKREYRKTAQRR